MKRFVAAVVLAVPLLAFAGSKPDAACKFSDLDKMKEHLKTHVTFPATGKDVKAACKKEIPDEFPKEERACFESKVKDGAKFQSADEVFKAIGI